MISRLLKQKKCYSLLDDAPMLQDNDDILFDEQKIFTHENYVYVETNEKVSGFIISRNNALKILSLIENKFGAEKLHNPSNRDKVCHILHKRSELDLTFDEWKAMGKNKPRKAKW